MKNNVLSPRQIARIEKRVAEAFSEDISGQITINLDSLRKQINQILSAMELEETFHSKDNKHKGWKLATVTPRRQSLAFKGYLIIMKFRQWLTGKEINYRYYYEDSNGISHVTEFSEKVLGNYIKFSEAGIILDTKALKGLNVKAEWDSCINQYFNLITSNKYMLYESGKGFAVTNNVLKQYSVNEKLKTVKGQLQYFNKGHIYEAIDNSMSHIIFKEEQSLTEKAVINYVFGKYLAYDNIKGSRSADNIITSTSIKSGGADLYDYITIYRQLKDIKLILTNGALTKEDMQKKISDNFLHKKNFDNCIKDFDKCAKDSVKKIIEQLKIKAALKN